MSAANPKKAGTQNRMSLLRKRAARLAAVQAIYSHLLENSGKNAHQLSQMILAQWEDSRRDKDGTLPTDAMPDNTLLTTIITRALEERGNIDTAINAMILPGWSRERTSTVLIATLMAAGAEWLASSRAAGMLVDEYASVGASLLSEEELSYLHKALHVMFDGLARE